MFLAAAGPNFCLGDLFYYYELYVCILNKSKLILVTPSHLGLMVVSLTFHPDDPGSIPGRISSLSTFDFIEDD